MTRSCSYCLIDVTLTVSCVISNWINVKITARVLLPLDILVCQTRSFVVKKLCTFRIGVNKRKQAIHKNQFRVRTDAMQY